MICQTCVGPLSDIYARQHAATRAPRAGVKMPLVAMLLSALLALIALGSAHDASDEYTEAELAAMRDAHDLRALGYGSVPYFAPSRPRPVEAPLTVRRVPALNAEQQNVARFLARRYRLAIEQTQHFVEYAYRTAREFKVDPLLILAVISVESSFNPSAESQQGAQGLMQILTRVHAEKFAPFGGVSAAFDPLANIKVGAQILKEYLGRDGTVEGALKAYVGAALLPDDGGYGAKVLSERRRIAAAAQGGAQVADKALKAPTVISRAQPDTAAGPRDI